jgi:hypothetical protein
MPGMPQLFPTHGKGAPWVTTEPSGIGAVCAWARLAKQVVAITITVMTQMVRLGIGECLLGVYAKRRVTQNRAFSFYKICFLLRDAQ